MDDIVHLLFADHEEIERLLQQLVNPPVGAAAMAQEFAMLRDRLLNHAAFEERRIYPLLLHGNREGVDDHREAVGLLEALGRAEERDESWRARLAELEEEMRQHMYEEETALLPRLRAQVPQGTLALLAGEYRRLLERPVRARAARATARPAAKPAARRRRAGPARAQRR